MQRGDEALVGLVDKGKGSCAKGVRLVGFERVVDYGVGVQMLGGGLAVVCLSIGVGGVGWYAWVRLQAAH